jgi:hypothetical protein
VLTRSPPASTGGSAAATGGAQRSGALADAEPLHPLPPAAFPADLAVLRKVSAQGLVDFRGNRYSAPPGLTRVDAVNVGAAGTGQQ